jgi:hypothetical protein
LREITSLDEVTTYPLCWPPNKERTASRVDSPFKTSMATAEEEISYEMGRLYAPRYVISRAPGYLRGGVDPGVALWFEIQHDALPELRVLACDKYSSVTANTHAIALTLEALRAVDRWGAYSVEQAIEGARLALPAPGEQVRKAWWLVIGVKREWPLDAIEAVWKTKLEKAHPDRGGSTEAMVELNVAITAARKEKGG